jgi:hypothetical protein
MTQLCLSPRYRKLMAGTGKTDSTLLIAHAETIAD